MINWVLVDKTNGCDDLHLFIGNLILHHLLLLQFNAFEVSELRQQDHNDQRTVFIGGSVYPTLALLNHSCDPCVVRYVYIIAVNVEYHFIAIGVHR